MTPRDIVDFSRWWSSDAGQAESEQGDLEKACTCVSKVPENFLAALTASYHKVWKNMDHHQMKQLLDSQVHPRHNKVSMLRGLKIYHKPTWGSFAEDVTFVYNTNTIGLDSRSFPRDRWVIFSAYLSSLLLAQLYFRPSASIAGSSTAFGKMHAA